MPRRQNGSSKVRNLLLKHVRYVSLLQFESPRKGTKYKITSKTKQIRLEPCAAPTPNDHFLSWLLASLSLFVLHPHPSMPLFTPSSIKQEYAHSRAFYLLIVGRSIERVTGTKCGHPSRLSEQAVPRGQALIECSRGKLWHLNSSLRNPDSRFQAPQYSPR